MALKKEQIISKSLVHSALSVLIVILKNLFSNLKF